MYNLLISADDEAFKKPAGTYDLDRSRLGEYTTNVLQEKYKKNVQALTENPTLFANEYGSKNPGQVGWIRKIEERQNTLRLHYEMQPKFPTIPAAKLEELVWELDFGQLEHYRTHMAVKDVDLMSVLTTAGIIKKEQNKKEAPDMMIKARSMSRLPPMFSKSLRPSKIQNSRRS